MHHFYSFFPRLKLEETREVQNLRKRPNGVSAAALLVGEKVQEETTLVVSVGSSLWLLFLRYNHGTREIAQSACYISTSIHVWIPWHPMKT